MPRPRKAPPRPEDLPTIWEAPDALWSRIAPIIADLDPAEATGRPRIDALRALEAILFRLRSGCQWNHLPKDLLDDRSVHRTFQRWVARGVFDRIWADLVDACAELGGVDWEWQAAYGAMGKAHSRWPAPWSGIVACTAGQLVTETFNYDGGRQVTVYVPLAPSESIVFAGDGGWHISRLGEVLEAANAPSTMIIGVHGLADDDARLWEYSPVFAAERFAAHEQFFVDDVRQWVRSRFGVALPAERTAVWGASAGGELALAIGFRHPDIYGAVFSASPAGGYRPTDVMPSPLPRVYLVAGTLEPFFLENAARWAVALRDGGADVVMTERVGSHGDAFWREEFPLMVAWAFGR